MAFPLPRSRFYYNHVLKMSLEDDETTEETEAIIEEIVRNPPKYINIMLHSFATNNHISLLERFLEKRDDLELDLDAFDYLQCTPLMLSISNRNFIFAKILINANCDVNVRNKRKETAIFHAVQQYSVEMVKELIKHGAFVNAQNIDGDTPLHILLRPHWNDIAGYYSRSLRERIVPLLISNGADVNICNKMGVTPVHHAIETRDEKMVAVVLDAGANLTLKKLDLSALILLFLSFHLNEDLHIRALQLNCDVNFGTSNECTPLHYAVKINAKRTAYELIKKGANIDSCEYRGITSLHVATNSHREEIASMLLYYGANARILDNKCYSPVVNSFFFPEDELSHVMLDCYDLNGDDRYHIAEALVNNLDKYNGNKAFFTKALAKFISFVNENDKILIEPLTIRIKNKSDVSGMYCNYLKAVLLFFSSIRSKKFDARTHFPFYNYYIDVLHHAKETNRSTVVKLVWLSRSLGSSIAISELNHLIRQFTFTRELEALIFGGYTSGLFDENKKGARYEYAQLFFQLLNSDMESHEGKMLLVNLLCNSGKDYPKHCSKLLRFFSLPMIELDSSSTEEFDASLLRDLRQIPRVKRLKELSRNRVRASLVERYQTNNFVETHHIINGLDVCAELKNYLQLRIPNKCTKCNYQMCDCYLQLFQI